MLENESPSKCVLCSEYKRLCCYSAMLRSMGFMFLVSEDEIHLEFFINVSCIRQENRKDFLILKYFGTVLPVELMCISITR